MGFLDQAKEEADQIVAVGPSKRDLQVESESGVSDEFGMALDTRRDIGKTIDKGAAQRMGYRADQKGFWEGFADSVNRTSKEVVKGTAKTFGADMLASSIETGLEHRKDLTAVEWSDSKMGWLGDSLGMGITESAGLIATSAAASSLGAPGFVAAGLGIAGTYARLYGENKETLVKMNEVGMDEGELTAMAISLTLFQSAIETGFGVEAKLGQAIGGRKAANLTMKKLLATKSGKEFGRTMGREFFKPTNPVTGAMSGAVKEYMEEVAQEMAAIESEARVSGKYPTRDQIMNRAVIQPLRALPAGALMGAGAYSHVESESKADSEVKKVSDEDVATMHAVEDEQGELTLDDDKSRQSLDHENATFKALAVEVAKVKGVTEKVANDTVTFLHETAYSMARLARRHGKEGAMPVDFIDGLRVAALSESLTEQDVNAISEIQQRDGTSQERSDAMMEYLGGRFGSKSKLYGAIQSMRQASQIQSLNNLMDQLERRASVNGAPKPTSKEAVKLFNEKIKQVAMHAIGSRLDGAIAALETRPVTYSLKNIPDNVLSSTEAAQLYMYGATFKHNKISYSAVISDGMLTIQKAGDAEVDVDGVITERKAAEDPKGQAKETADEEIGSDAPLARARAEYAKVANRVIGLEEFVEYYGNRETAKPPVTSDTEIANTVYQGDGGQAITGLEIIQEAADDAGKPLSVDAMRAAEERFSQYGDGAFDLYKSIYVMGEVNARNTADRIAQEAQADTDAEVNPDIVDEVVAPKQPEKKKGRLPKSQRTQDPMVARAQINVALDEVESVIDEQDVSEDPEFIKKSAKTMAALIKAAEDLQSGPTRSLANKVKRIASRVGRMRRKISADQRAEIDARLAADEAHQQAVEDFDARMSDLQALREAFPDATIAEANKMLDGEYEGDADLLLQSDGGEVGGLYDKSGNIAMFFGAADAGTVIHEISHHMFHMLPTSAKVEIQSSLKTQKGVAADIEAETIGVATEEAFANSMLTYITTAELPTELGQESRMAYEEIRGGIGSFTKTQLENVGIEMNEETAEFFDTFLGEIDVTEIHGVMAEAAMTGIQTDPPTHNDVLDAVADGESKADVSEVEKSPVLFQRGDVKKSKNMADAKRMGMIRQIIYRKVARRAGSDDVSTTVHQLIREMFPDVYGNKDISEISLKELSMAQLQEVEKRLTTNKKTNIESKKITDDVISAEADRPTEEHPDVVHDTKRSAIKSTIVRAVNKALDFNTARFSNLSFFTRFLDNFMYDGIWGRTFLKPVMDARQDGAKILERTKERFNEIKERHGIKRGALGTIKNINIDGRRMSESQVVLLYIASKKVRGEVSNAQRAIMESNDIPQEMFDAATAHVRNDAELKQYAEYLIDAYKEVYDVVNPTYKKMTGKDLNIVENYFPLIRKDTMYSDKDVIAPLLEVVSAVGRDIQQSRMSRLNARSQIAGSQIRLDNADSALVSYATSAANYAAKAETIKRLSDAVHAREMADHLKRIYGAERGGKIHKMMEKQLAREMFPNAQTTGMTDGQLIVKDVRNRFTLAMLGGRLMTMPKQTVSYFNFMALMSGALSPRFMTQSVVNMATLNKVIFKNFLANVKRAKDGTHLTDGYLHPLAGHPIHDMLRDMAPIIYDRHGNPETADFEQHGYKGALSLKIAGVPLGDIAMGGLKMFDMATIGTAWYTGYNHILNQEIEGGATHEQASKKAAEEINQMISDSQPPSVPHERTIGQTDNEYVRAMFPFSGQTMLNWQNWNYGVLIPSIKMLSKGDVKGLFRKEGVHASIAQRLAFGFMVPALALGVLSRRRWPKDKEEMALDLFLYPISQVPAIGSSLAHGLGTGWRDVQTQPIYASVGNDVMRSVIDVANLVRGEEFGEKKIKEFTEAASVLASVPTAYTRFLHVVTREILDNGLSEWDHLTVLEAYSAEVKD